MPTSHLPLNALRAFEASARQLSFTRAGLELTDEGQALLPAIADSFGRIRATLDRFEDGYFREVVTVGVVGTFATGWLLPRLKGFEKAHPHIDLRLLTNNNNRV